MSIDQEKMIVEALPSLYPLQKFEEDAIHAVLNSLSTIQPDNGLQKLADEIATFKRCVKSENSDYLTGYLCSLSAVEGMIAEKREVTT